MGRRPVQGYQRILDATNSAQVWYFRGWTPQSERQCHCWFPQCSWNRSYSWTCQFPGSSCSENQLVLPQLGLPFTRLLRPGFLPSDPQALWEHIERRFLWWWSNQRDIMKKLSEMYLSEVLKESVLTPFVKGRLQEAEQYLSHIQTLIPEQIEADKRLLAQLSGEKRSEGEIIRTYRPILDGTLNIQEKVAFFGLREAGVANICSERLDWKQRVIYTRRWRIFHCVPGKDDKAWRRTGCGAEGLLRSPLSQKCKPYHSGGKSVEVNCSTYESGKKEKYFLCRALSLFALKERVLLEYKTRIWPEAEITWSANLYNVRPFPGRLTNFFFVNRKWNKGAGK